MSHEGPEKYIFISYAHRDSEQVIHILEALASSGYRIWYDDGIAPGSEWPEDIAEHLDGCAVFLAFISNNSMESANCRREINFALSRQKPFLGILLEPTDMSLGMEMQLSSHQCILRYSFRHEADFLRKIFSTPDLRACKEPEPERVVPESVDAAPAPAPVKEERSAPRPAPDRRKAPEEKAKVSSLAVISGVILALVLLCTVLWTLYDGGNLVLAPNVTVSQDANTVILMDVRINANSIRQLGSMENLSSLHIYNCSMDPGTLDGMDLPHLRELYIHDVPLYDFRFLEKSPNLSVLSLENCGVNNGNFPAESLTNLSFLSLAGNPDFSELARIPTGQLQNLDISNTSVFDISCLADATELRQILCANTHVDNVDPLADLAYLKIMDFSNCPISQVSSPFAALSMKTINFTNCGLEALDGFQNFTVLEHVSLGGNHLTRIDWLEKSSATLISLDLSGNPLGRDSLGFLKNAQNLQILNVSGLALDDLSLVKDLRQLMKLRASGCQLRDISHLSGLPNLQELYLDRNQISSLSGLPAMAAASGNRLNLAYNRITDISALTGEFYVIALQGNPIALHGGSFSGWSASHLALDYTEDLLSSDVPVPTCRIHLTNCPADRQIAIQEKFSSHLKLLSEDALLKKLEELGISYPELAS